MPDANNDWRHNLWVFLNQLYQQEHLWQDSQGIQLTIRGADDLRDYFKNMEKS